mgnify:CR=1 FL=1
MRRIASSARKLPENTELFAAATNLDTTLGLVNDDNFTACLGHDDKKKVW